jgi:hypothetical protein
MNVAKRITADANHNNRFEPSSTQRKYLICMPLDLVTPPIFSIPCSSLLKITTKSALQNAAHFTDELCNSTSQTPHSALLITAISDEPCRRIIWHGECLK